MSSSSTPFVHTPDSLQYAVTHVFFPHKLSKEDDYTKVEMDFPIGPSVCAAVHAYSPHIHGTSEDGLWHRISKMLDNLRAHVQSEHLDKDHIVSQLCAMQTKDILTLFIRPQNAAIIFTKQESYTLCESFEVTPRKTDVGMTAGPLICAYPWSAVETPNTVFDNVDFQAELANFLSLPVLGSDYPGFPLPPRAYPQYITTLLTGILRGVGRAVDVARITKRVRDEAEWCRSPLWLLIKIAIQMSVDRSCIGRNSYKQFMLYFMCTLATDRNNVELSSDLLHLMACKILRRLDKLGASTPFWLSEIALGTCAHLREILDARWKHLSTPPSPFRNPSQDDLIRDTKLSLVNSREYIRNALTNTTPEPRPPFHPSDRRRGTLEDFLSSDRSFLEEAFRIDRLVTPYDVEQSVEQGIDDWLASVTNVDDACTQLEILMDEYTKPRPARSNPEDASITFLTLIELFIALDKLVMKEIPMLVDYSPEVPLARLEEPFLRKATSFYRLSRAYQYLAARHAQSRPGWSVLSNEFTRDSFPVRYYDQSVHLQQIKARIDQEAFPTPFSALPSHAKVVVFELQCPTCIRTWRSAVARIRHNIQDFYFDRKEQKYRLLVDVPELRPYIAERQGLPLHIQVDLAYSCQEPRNAQVLQYVVHQNNQYCVWWPSSESFRFEYDLRTYPYREYVNSTTHTSNDILAAQANCPSNFSLDEFITFGHLRSGGLLQWFNILQGLHSRALNIARKEVHFLLSRASFQVGPLDLNTGSWTWHQALEDPCFCRALLDELDRLVMDVGARAIDDVFMSTASLLLARVLASSPSEDVTEKAVVLLRNIRRRTFDWMQDLAYDLAISPMNEERANRVLDMAITCRSTFDVDPAMFSGLYSSMDVDALLSCFFNVRSLRPNHFVDSYTELLLLRDSRLFPALEEMLRSAILADPSDYSIDLAVAKVLTSHHPGAHRWEQLHHSKSHWLTCKTYQSSHTVHVTIDLLDGSLRVDGRLCGGLPPEIRRQVQHFFGTKIFFVTPSNLPGMDFMTAAITSKYKVHFAVQDQKLMVQAQCNETNEILELIPEDKFRGDLPPTLVFGKVHWLNRSRSMIEIRPLRQLWDQSAENWRIHCAFGQYSGHKGRETLVDIQSSTTAIVYKCFQPIVDDIYESTKWWDHLLTTLITEESGSEQRLSLALHDYGLSFFVNEEEVFESVDYRNMVMDENRSAAVGTLFGLKEFLVLRPKTHLAGTTLPEALIPRLVIVPNAYPGGDGLHLTYNVDTELGCLMGNGSLTSMQFHAYMHAAATSHHRPDPLTGKLGPQTALCSLQSAGCRSIMKLKAFFHPGSCTHPQLEAAHEQIRDRHYWERRSEQRPGRSFNPLAERTSQRAVHLFPSHATVPASTEDGQDKAYLFPASESDLELEDIISAAASAMHRWLMICDSTTGTTSNWRELWRSIEMHAGTSLSYAQDSPGKPGLSDDLAQTLITKAREAVENREEKHQRYSLLFLLPTMAFYSPRHWYQTSRVFFVMLVTFSMQIQPHLGNLPIHPDCKIAVGYRPTERVLRLHIERFHIETQSSPYVFKLYDASNAAQQLAEDWPWEMTPISLDPQHWDVVGLRASLRQQFSSYYHNWILKEHLVRVLVEPGSPHCPRAVSPSQFISNARASLQISLDQLLSSRPAPQLPPRNILTRDHPQLGEHTSTPSNDIPALGRLFSSLQTNSAFQREYVALLETCASVCRKYRTTYDARAPRDYMEALRKHYEQCRDNYMDALSRIKRSLGPTTGREEALEQFGQWPALTADNLLRCLASTARINLSSQWKTCLVSFSLLLLELQRARRLLRFAMDDLEEEFMRELHNEQCDGWDPEEYPDWLLIQVQGNFLIRRAQAETAMEMISPQSGQNTVMQVNMGEGKSSVIIPIVAAALADGNQLVRVVVPKALSVQMFELLVSRLGGLANRPVYHLPFSRTPEREDGKVISLRIDDLLKLVSQCVAEHGVLLVQPEHVVSLKLMSVEAQMQEGNIAAHLTLPNSEESVRNHITKCLSLAGSILFPEGSLLGNIFRWWVQSPRPDLSGKRGSSQAPYYYVTGSKGVHGASENASKWLSLQNWLHDNVRDILDESDEILHPRFQLIYATGHEQHMDGYPDRWTIIQHVLRIVKDHAPTLSINHPDSVSEHGPPGSFPHIRIVRESDIGRCLISMVVEDVMAGRLPDFSFFRHISPGLRDAIRSFISDENVLQVADTAKRVEEYAKQSQRSHLWSALLLLRGLLASNILLFALTERRWRVDYGRDSSPPHKDLHSRQFRSASTRLAVPYRAKDVPASNTEFGHPDLAIILTCLSYYYAGLTEEQLRASFDILLNQDDPSVEYATWIEDYDIRTLPDSLRELTGVNLRSSEQWDNVTFPLFAWNKATIDFYLAQVVFPKEAKEFPWKLCGSSWDLGEKREKLITGFSGTSDGRWLLPMSVAQHDLDDQRGTNAKVLSYLLQPENDTYMVIHENGERQTSLGFLQMVALQRPEIHVLLDVGAQILDSSNREVAAAWLDIVRSASGAIYFDENDELMVLTRTGITQRLSSSPLAQQLGHCVVYLDHAHTRGTDLKFPVGLRAAVTLGPKVTKDVLVQGCMRMRKLGHGHSVMFFAPPGVDQSIRSVTSKKDPATTRITTADVLCWAIHETWIEIRQRAPYWAQQGMNHKRRYEAWSRFCGDELTPEQLFEVWLQPERKSLADLYAPSENERAKSDLSALDPQLRQRCKDLGVLSLPSAQMDEEQEREVNREREREREVELPPKAKPAEHYLHPDVVSFVKTGIIPPLHSGNTFFPVFTTLGKTSAAPGEVDVWSPFILATADFCRTIDPESTVGTLDQYLRPVQWVLSSKRAPNQVLVILSPFEADRLLPDIRVSERVHLHLYAPRTSKRMTFSGDLGLYAIPPLPSDWIPPWDLIDQLNVFSGQLYLRDYDSYLRLCHFLGIPSPKVSQNDVAKVRRNLFNIPGAFEETEITFADSPLPSVMGLLAIRTRGRPFAHTHMGRILQGQVLTEKDFGRV